MTARNPLGRAAARICTRLSASDTARALTAATLSSLLLLSPLVPLYAQQAAKSKRAAEPATQQSGGGQARKGGTTVGAEKHVTLPAPGLVQPLVGGSVTVGLSAQIVNDDGDTKLDPTTGQANTEKLTYTATLSNTTAANAAGVNFSDTIDSHTTLVVGSVNSSPLALADGYNLTADTTNNVAANAGLLANDFDPDNGVNTNLSVTSYGQTTGGEQTSVGTSTPTAHGSVALNADGSFAYTPAGGFQGTDSFKYRISDGTSFTNNTDIGTVTIIVDAPPSVTTTTPTNNATGVAINGTITVNFSETVNAASGFAAINCGGAVAYTPTTGSNTNSIVLTPTGGLPPGSNCTVTLDHTKITDVDTNDPPDTMASDYTFSFKVNPQAVNDTYPVTLVGNVSTDSSANSSPLPFSSTGNDVSANPYTITAFDAISANGGNVVMTTSGAGIGRFTYDPPAGYTGNDTFTYTISRTDGGGSATATVTIPISGMVWFVNNGAASCTAVSSGCGRLSHPFSTLAAFNSANGQADVPGSHVFNPAANDNIFIYESATGYSGAVTLLSGQKLIGQDASVSLSTITGLTPPTGSPSFPAMNSGNATVTNITSTVTLNTNATVRGLSINSTTSAGMSDPASAITGVSVSEVSVATTTGTAVSLSGVDGTLSFKSVSANGAANGISLSSFAQTSGSFTVTGDGTNDSSGGTIQNTTGDGVSLTNAKNVSLTSVSIQSTKNSGVKGTGVVNFTLANSTVNNSGLTSGGTIVGTVDDSNVNFGAHGAGTENNLSGVVTITGNTLTNGFYNGVFIYNFAGTISNANISNNTISSSTVTANSQGSGILFVGFGTASAVSSVTKATIDGNTIQHFPSQGGVGAQFGNAVSGGPAGTYGDAADTTNTNAIRITNNNINGGSVQMNTDCVLATIEGNGSGNLYVSNNGTAANPLGKVNGHVIGVQLSGSGQMRTTVDNNYIVANNIVGSDGITVGESNQFGTTDTPQMTAFIRNNHVSNTDGTGIFVDAAKNTGYLNATVTGNIVSKPTGASATGIQVWSNNNVNSGGNTTVCLLISGNTSASSSNSTNTVTSPGIGIRKQGTAAGTNEFGIVGLSGTVASPTSSAAMESYVASQNPNSASGTFGTGGAYTVAGDNFLGCSSATPSTPALSNESAGARGPAGEKSDYPSASTQITIPASDSPQVGDGARAAFAAATLSRMAQQLAAAPDSVTREWSDIPVGHTNWAARQISASYADNSNSSRAGVRFVNASYEPERAGAAHAPNASTRPNMRAASATATAAAFFSGETVTVAGSGSGFTLPAGKTVTVVFAVTLNNLPSLSQTSPAQVSDFGTLSGSFGPSINTSTVNTPVDRFHSTTTLGTSGSPSQGGDQVTFTATASFDTAETSPTPSTPTTPTGTVSFIDTSNGNASVCSNVALSGGTAQCQTSSLSAGSTHNVQAIYSGDGNYNGSTSNTVAQQVVAPPALSISDVAQAEGNAGQTAFTFTVSLDQPAGAGGVSFNWSTADGTAKAPGDYTAITNAGGSISQGQTSTTVTVQVNGDAIQEPNETFFVNVSGVSGATVSDGQGQGTILNDDGAPSAGQIVISEFRLRGPDPDGAGPLTGSDDEFIELYNNTDSDFVVADSSPLSVASAGWAVVSSDAPTTAKVVVAAGTTIPARGHFLVANGVGYSLSAYAAADAPGGVSATYNVDIPEGAGLALFRTGNPALFAAPSERLDSVGFAGAPPLFFEGTPLQPAGGITASAEHSFVRKMTAGTPQDTDDNSADFMLVSTTGVQLNGVQSLLGAPGPENKNSPVNRGATIKAVLFDPAVSSSATPNRERSGTSVPNGTTGTLLLRRTFNNNTGASVTRLRFRVVDMTAGPTSLPGTADLRLLSTTAGSTTITGGGSKSWVAMTLDVVPSQPIGGGFNSTVVAIPGNSLPAGGSINVQFTLGVNQAGSFKFFVIVEGLP